MDKQIQFIVHIDTVRRWIRNHEIQAINLGGQLATVLLQLLSIASSVSGRTCLMRG